MLIEAYRIQTEPEQSQIEHFLAEYLKSHSEAKWHQQVEVVTPFSKFYLDMACLVRKDHAIAVECDGREFHGDTVKELCRDALILNTGRIKRMYHIEAWAIKKRQYDWLYLLSQSEPELFTPERHLTIKALLDGYNQVTMTTASRRSFRFIYCRTSASEEVKAILDFAKRNSRIPFRELVERGREDAGVRQHI